MCFFMFFVISVREVGVGVEYVNVMWNVCFVIFVFLRVCLGFGYGSIEVKFGDVCCVVCYICGYGDVYVF